MSGEYRQHHPAGANDRHGVPAPTRRNPGHPTATRSNQPHSNRAPTGANGEFIFQMLFLVVVTLKAFMFFRILYSTSLLHFTTTSDNTDATSTGIIDINCLSR